MTTDTDARQLVYFADPMCSWCWGFSPVIARIHEMVDGQVPMRIVVGGLRAYNTAEMAQSDKNYIRGHWEHVQERSGQPFNFAFFDRESFVYDTEPACRAVVAVREIAPQNEFAMLAQLHKAFYADGRDTTNRQELIAIAGEQGIDQDAFAEAFDSDNCRQAARTDFATSNQSGVSGFPTLIAGTHDLGFQMMTTGYQEIEHLEPKIRTWLDS